MTRHATPVVAIGEQAFRDAEFEYYPRWRAGEVVPARITMLLDARGLYGPDVDLACGAREPDVDMWEAGTRYPTWPQLTALARLVDATPAALFGPMRLTGAVFVCGRGRRGPITLPQAITAYPEAVWRPVVNGLTDTLFDLPPSGALA